MMTVVNLFSKSKLVGLLFLHWDDIVMIDDFMTQFTDLFQAHQETPASQPDLLYDPSQN